MAVEIFYKYFFLIQPTIDQIEIKIWKIYTRHADITKNKNSRE